MVKIKFYLYFNDRRIRTLDDLRENFCIDDILDAYDNGKLEQWLDVWGHREELAEVRELKASGEDNAREVLRRLIEIFRAAGSPDDVDEALSTYDYITERKEFWETVKSGGKNTAATQSKPEPSNPEKYIKIFDEYAQRIIDNHDNLSRIYDCLDDLSMKHSDVLGWGCPYLLCRLYTILPYTALALLGHHAARPYCESFHRVLDDIFHDRKPYPLNYLFVKVYNADLWPSDTWRTVEPPDKDFILLRNFGKGFYVAGTHTHDTPLESGIINTNRPVLRGIDIKHTYGMYTLLFGVISFAYMEAR